MSYRYQTRSNSAKKAPCDSNHEIASNCNNNSKDFSHHKSQPNSLNNSSPGQDHWQDHDSVKELESNSSFLAEQNHEGISTHLSYNYNFNNKSSYHSTGLSPNIPQSINLSTSQFIYLENMDSRASVVTQSSVQPPPLQKARQEVSTSSLSFPSQSSSISHQPMVSIHTQYRFSDPAVNQPTIPYTQQSSCHREVLTFPPSSVSPSLTSMSLHHSSYQDQNLHLPVTLPQPAAQNENLSLELPGRSGPMLENPGLASPNFASQLFNSLPVRTHQFPTLKTFLSQGPAYVPAASITTATLSATTIHPTRLSTTSSIMNTTTTLPPRHVTVVQGLSHSANNSIYDDDSDDKDSFDDSHDPDQDDDAFCEEWNWSALTICGCMYDVYSTLKRPLPRSFQLNSAVMMFPVKPTRPIATKLHLAHRGLKFLDGLYTDKDALQANRASMVYVCAVVMTFVF